MNVSVGVAGVCRFDRLVYLDIADDVNSKVLVLQALTRGCVHYHMICCSYCYCCIQA